MELFAEDYPIIIPSQGIVRAHNEITISARVSGQVSRIGANFETGSHLSAGDILVEVDTRDYEIAVAVAEARVASAESQVEIARHDHNNRLTLFERDFVGIGELNRFEAERIQAEASLESAMAELDQARLELSRTVVRAPFDGRVREKAVGVGQSIGSGATLGVIFAVDYAEVRLPISARDRSFLRLPESDGAPPLPVVLRDAINPDSGMSWNGMIVRTEGVLDEGSLEVIAIARVEDPFGMRTGYPPLRIGQPVTGYVRGEVLRDVVPIPRAAVRELDQIVLVGKSDLRLNKVRIRPIWSDENYILVPDSEVFDGRYLATTHIVYAPEGSQVELIPSTEATDPTGDFDEETGA